MLASAQTAFTGSNENWIPRDQDLRILEVRVKQYSFEDVVAAYQFEDIVLLPLGELSELLEIAIEVRPGEASGFVIREDRSFFLDIARQQITLQGVIETYDPDKVHQLLNDIYVDANLLGKWMNMSFDIDLFASRIVVRSDVPLPFLQRIERERRIKQSLSRLNLNQDEYPRLYEPYQDWSVPFVDQTVRLSRRKTESGDTINNYDYSTYATADLAKHEASLYFSGNDDEPSDVFRLTLGRKDPQGGLLGGLDVTEYAVGHLVEPRVALINQPGSIEPLSLIHI